MDSGITLLQWNCRSLPSNKYALERLLQKYKVDIALLSETWLGRSPFTPKIKGYKLVHTEREDGFGGSAIAIKNNIPFTEINITYNNKNLVQVSSVEISLFGQKCSVVSIYAKPKHKLSKNFWDNLISQVGPTILLGGDLNLHDESWGCETTDPESNDFLEAVGNQNLYILNDGSETLIQKPNNKRSAVDLTCCTPNISTRTFWETIKDGSGSNHYPILITIGNKNHNKKLLISPKQKWDTKKADWDLYHFTIKHLASTYNSTDNIVTDYDNFIDIINQAADVAIPKFESKIINPHRSKLWWDPECQKAENDRKTAFLEYNKQKNYSNYIKCLNLSALTRNLFKKKEKTKLD